MTFSMGQFRAAPLLLAGLLLGGCLPSGPKDEEKEPYFLVGKSRVNTMDFKGAVESFEKAVEVNPKSAPAHFELGWLYDQKESDPAAAIYHYERFLKLSPNSGKEEMVKTRILACEQQLAQSVSFTPATEKQQRDIEQLMEERSVSRRRLRNGKPLRAGCKIRPIQPLRDRGRLALPRLRFRAIQFRRAPLRRIQSTLGARPQPRRHPHGRTSSRQARHPG